jgi:hypothetical protein
MLEAKGPNYADKLEEDNPFVWPNIEADLDGQVKRQSDAANAAGRMVEWHFAEKTLLTIFARDGSVT